MEDGGMQTRAGKRLIGRIDPLESEIVAGMLVAWYGQSTTVFPIHLPLIGET
jgi:hypothetical protein